MKRVWMLVSAGTLFMASVVATGRIVNQEAHHIPRILGTQLLVFSPDGKKLVTMGESGTDVWDTQTYVHLSHCSTRYTGYNFLYLSDHFLFCPLVKDDTEVHNDLGQTYTDPGFGPWNLWRVNTLTAKEDFDFKFASQEPQKDVDFYGVRVDVNEIVCESRLETRVLEAQNGQVIRVQKQHRTVINAQLVPDGKTLCQSNGSDLSRLFFFRMNDGKRLWKWNTGVFLVSPHFSQDGHLVMVFKNGMVVARDTQTGKETWRLRGLQSEVFALTPNGHALYEARRDGQIWSWRLR